MTAGETSGWQCYHVYFEDQKVLPVLHTKFGTTATSVTHLENIYSINTQHEAFFCGLDSFSADVSKNALFVNGFIKKNRKGNIAADLN